ncbi:MAG: hypothetical protein KAX33_09390, partial [Candidatus Lokiarchaeota archaeon]|nr:hypothetical protein [Candidatus Lokiarchaeota archaeon]
MNLKKKSILFISLLFSSMLIINCVNLTGNKTLQENNTNNFSIKNLKSSAIKNISSSDILQNITQVRRYYDTINITLKNLDEFDNATELDVYINVSFTNGTLVNYSMIIVEDLNISYWLFTPAIDSILGIQYANFSIFNNTGQDLINNQTTQTNFTILNNLPECAAYLDTTKIYRNQFL